MEFYRFIKKETTEKELQQRIKPENVAEFAESMLYLNSDGRYFNAITLWGDFNISYDQINGGVRFTLLSCPNAVAWTITTGYPPHRNQIVLHSTANRTQKPLEFMEEYQEFLDEWEAGLNANF